MTFQPSGTNPQQQQFFRHIPQAAPQANSSSMSSTDYPTYNWPNRVCVVNPSSEHPVQSEAVDQEPSCCTQNDSLVRQQQHLTAVPPPSHSSSDSTHIGDTVQDGSFSHACYGGFPGLECPVQSNPRCGRGFLGAHAFVPSCGGSVEFRPDDAIPEHVADLTYSQSKTGGVNLSSPAMFNSNCKGFVAGRERLGPGRVAGGVRLPPEFESLTEKPLCFERASCTTSQLTTDVPESSASWSGDPLFPLDDPIEEEEYPMMTVKFPVPRPFGHPPPVSTLTLSSPTALLSSAPEWQAQFYKTKLCPFFVRDIPDSAAAAQFGANVGNVSGVCTNGTNCRFAHSFTELRPLPDLRKTKLCTSYTRRVPCKNPRCPFAHSPQELRTSSSVFYKVTLCNFYKNGRCWNGANCRFAHGSEELRSAVVADPESGEWKAVAIASIEELSGLGFSCGEPQDVANSVPSGLRHPSAPLPPSALPARSPTALTSSQRPETTTFRDRWDRHVHGASAKVPISSQRLTKPRSKSPRGQVNGVPVAGACVIPALLPTPQNVVPSQTASMPEKTRASSKPPSTHQVYVQPSPSQNGPDSSFGIAASVEAKFCDPYGNPVKSRQNFPAIVVDCNMSSSRGFLNQDEIGDSQAPASIRLAEASGGAQASLLIGGTPESPEGAESRLLQNPQHGEQPNSQQIDIGVEMCPGPHPRAESESVIGAGAHLATRLHQHSINAPPQPTSIPQSLKVTRLKATAPIIESDDEVPPGLFPPRMSPEHIDILPSADELIAQLSAVIQEGASDLVHCSTLNESRHSLIHQQMASNATVPQTNMASQIRGDSSTSAFEGASSQPRLLTPESTLCEKEQNQLLERCIAAAVAASTASRQCVESQSCLGQVTARVFNPALSRGAAEPTALTNELIAQLVAADAARSVALAGPITQHTALVPSSISFGVSPEMASSRMPSPQTSSLRETPNAFEHVLNHTEASATISQQLNRTPHVAGCQVPNVSRNTNPTVMSSMSPPTLRGNDGGLVSTMSSGASIQPAHQVEVDDMSDFASHNLHPKGPAVEDPHAILRLWLSNPPCTLPAQSSSSSSYPPTSIAATTASSLNETPLVLTAKPHVAHSSVSDVGYSVISSVGGDCAVAVPRQIFTAMTDNLFMLPQQSTAAASASSSMHHQAKHTSTFNNPVGDPSAAGSGSQINGDTPSPLQSPNACSARSAPITHRHHPKDSRMTSATGSLTEIAEFAPPGLLSGGFQAVANEDLIGLGVQSADENAVSHGRIVGDDAIRRLIMLLNGISENGLSTTC